MVRPPFPWLLITLSLLLPLSCGASEPQGAGPLIDVLLNEARDFHLATQPQWIKLGHYRPNLGGGWASEVDGSSFFLSRSGKNDPEAELEATLRGLFAAPEGPTDDDHALCAFPARATWLIRELGIDPGQLPRVECAGLTEFLRKIDPVSVTFIFSSYYLNNPVSAFGHTFLRLNSAASARSPARRELLDYGIDYSAATGRENAVLYAFKGLFGMFPGVFSAMPYFYKVRKYNDMESRDIWEYELSLTQDETRLLAKHLWELGRTYIDYWYLTENCSYHILGLLEAARPNLNLISRLSRPVLPANTVKAVFDEPGLVSRITYRPSIRSQFRQRIRPFDRQQLEVLAEIAEHPEASIPDGYPADRASQVFDAALDLVEMRHFRELIQEPEGEAARIKQRILERRAGLGVTSPDLEPRPDEFRLPHIGHGSRRAGLGLGTSTQSGGFAELSLRASLHDLLDPPAGYPETSQIEFLPVRLRTFFDDNRLHLEDGYIVRVQSISPRDRFEKALSWKLAVGATTIHDPGCPGACTAARLGTGAGLAWAWHDDAAILFCTLDTDLLATPDLEGGLGRTPLRVGLGPSMGLRLRPGPHLVGLLSGKWSFLPAQDPGGVWKVEGGVRWGPNTDVALSAQAEAYPDDRSVSLSLNCYF